MYYLNIKPKLNYDRLKQYLFYIKCDRKRFEIHSKNIYRFFAASPALPPPLLLALFAGLRCGSGKIVDRLFYSLGVAVGLGLWLDGFTVAVCGHSPVAVPVANGGNRRACDT